MLNGAILRENASRLATFAQKSGATQTYEESLLGCETSGHTFNWVDELSVIDLALHTEREGETELMNRNENLSAWTGVTPERLNVLFERYGTRAEMIATYMNSGMDFILRSLPDYTLREIIFLAQHEKICHLDDFLLRRSMLAMLGRVTGEMIQESAKALGNALGWNEERKTAEVASTFLILADRHGVRL